MNILLADDDAVTRRLLEASVRGWGHEVSAVGDGQAAFDAYLHERPSLVVLDWQMPVLDGLEVCRRIRAMEDGRETFVLVLTARDAPDDVHLALAAGADDYMTKPVVPVHLRARLMIAELRIAEGAARRHAEAALARAQWLAGIGQTALAIQHEINNPLAALMGNAELATMDRVSATERTQYLRAVIAQAERIAQVVRRLALLEDPQTVEYHGGMQMLDLTG